VDDQQNLQADRLDDAAAGSNLTDLEPNLTVTLGDIPRAQSID